MCVCVHVQVFVHVPSLCMCLFVCEKCVFVLCEVTYGLTHSHWALGPFAFVMCSASFSQLLSCLYEFVVGVLD